MISGRIFIIKRNNGMNCHRKEKRMPKYRSFLTLVIFLCLLFVPVVGKAAQSGPTEVVKKLDTVLLKAMKGGDKLGYAGRYRLLAPVIKGSFALSETARIAAGRYWGEFSEEERNVYLKTYTEWTIATYAGRFNEYSGQQFRLISESAPEKGTVIVISKLIKSNKDEVEFNYQLLQAEGDWRIVDIRISGVSQLALTRAQFVSILGKSGFQGLIATLNSKIKDLAKGAGG
jgi:phospholipid transport system substrate-binding protein